MRAAIRDQIRILYDHHCGYCGVRESDAGARLTLDHFRPRSLGGSDEIDNLVYCCHGCKEFKGDHWHDDEALRLLHPLRDNIAAHIAQTEEALSRENQQVLQLLATLRQDNDALREQIAARDISQKGE